METRFNYRPYATSILWGGIFGMYLTLLYNRFAYGIYFAELDTWWPFWKEYFHFIVLYFFVVSILFITAGILLRKRKRFGVYLFLSAVFLIFASFFIIDKSGPTPSFFIETVSLSLYAIPFFAPILVLFFHIVWIVNIFKIKQWFLITKKD